MNKQALLRHLAEQGFSQTIVDAFAGVKREEFVPEAYRAYAYDDRALPLVKGQTISQPSMISWMLSLLELEKLQQKHLKILEIGSGSGYVLALLAALLPKAELYGLELEQELVVSSREKLHDSKMVHILERNGASGLPKQAPFERILVSAAAEREEVLNTLKEQLRDGGILVAPVQHDLLKLARTGERWKRIVFPNAVAFVPLKTRI